MAVCPICGGKLFHFGDVDFNRSAADVFERKRQFPISSEMVKYAQCGSCDFIRTDFFDSWSDHDFKDKIYNASYKKCDPPFEDERPEKISKFLGELLRDFESELNILDYGSGNGSMADKLGRASKHNVQSYDPFYDVQEISGAFDLITFFEVLEHVPDQNAFVENLDTLCDENTILLFSTLLQPSEVTIDWWYIGPRNGHISMHSETSLGLLWKKYGFHFLSFSKELHVAFKSESDLLEHIKMNVDSNFAVSDVPDTNHQDWSE